MGKEANFIISIGKELEDDRDNINVCCNNYKQYLSFMSHNMLYYNYVDSPSFQQSNVIVGFNANFTYCTWIDATWASRHINCSIILTYTSQIQAE